MENGPKITSEQTAKMEQYFQQMQAEQNEKMFKIKYKVSVLSQNIMSKFLKIYFCSGVDKIIEEFKNGMKLEKVEPSKEEDIEIGELDNPFNEIKLEDFEEHKDKRRENLKKFVTQTLSAGEYVVVETKNPYESLTELKENIDACMPAVVYFGTFCAHIAEEHVIANIELLSDMVYSVLSMLKVYYGKDTPLAVEKIPRQLVLSCAKVLSTRNQHKSYSLQIDKFGIFTQYEEFFKPFGIIIPDAYKKMVEVSISERTLEGKLEELKKKQFAENQAKTRKKSSEMEKAYAQDYKDKEEPQEGTPTQGESEKITNPQ